MKRLIPTYEWLESLLVAFGDRVDADDLTAETAAEAIGQAASIRIVLVENGRSLATELVGESRDGEAVRRVARDHAKRPRRDAGEGGGGGRRSDGGEATVVDMGRGHHRARVHVSDNGHDARRIDEVLRDLAGSACRCRSRRRRGFVDAGPTTRGWR